jgi:hypothetical protein
MTALAGDETTGEIEREAEVARARLAHTLDQLRDNLTPQHLADEVLGHARHGASTMLTTLSASAAKHPVPALLIGAGCAALLAAMTGRALAGQRDDFPAAPIPYAPSPTPTSQQRAPEAPPATRYAALGERPLVTAILGMVLGRVVAAMLPRG